MAASTKISKLTRPFGLITSKIKANRIQWRFYYGGLGRTKQPTLKMTLVKSKYAFTTDSNETTNNPIETFNDANSDFGSEAEFHEEANRTIDLVVDECNKLYDIASDDFDYNTAVKNLLNIFNILAYFINF